MPQKDSGIKPWQTISSSMALDEKWFPVRKDVVKLSSGRIVDDYFVWESPKIVLVIPITTKGQFVMVRQYRHAIGKVLIQFPGGGVDAKEAVAVAAARELEEETGYISPETPIFLGKFAPYPTKITCEVEVYLISNVEQNGHIHYDDQEETEVLLYNLDELLSMLDDKQVFGSDMYVCTLLALRHMRKI